VNTTIETKQVVLWDYDNTLGETEKVALENARNLLNTWLGNKGVADGLLYESASFQQEFVGTTFREIVSRAARRFGISVTEAELTELAYRERAEVIPVLARECKEMPYAIDALTELKAVGIKNIVVSSSHPDRLEACMYAAGQRQLISDVFSVQDPKSPTEPKPHPDIYLKAARELSIPHSKCIAVEDSVAGVTAAAGAGIDTLGFVGPYPQEQVTEMRTKLFAAGARWVISKLSEVPYIVRLLNSNQPDVVDRIYGQNIR
jgi:HAD superfamily hydrolase (TIGR01509 family)